MFVWKLVDESQNVLSDIALDFEASDAGYGSLASYVRSCSKLVQRSKPKKVVSTGTTSGCVSANSEISIFHNRKFNIPPTIDMSSPRGFNREYGGTVVLGGDSIPKDSHDMGDDSWFISETTLSFGVADGVGSWRDLGLQPRLFVDHLLKSCQKYLEKAVPAESNEEPVLMESLTYAFQDVQHSENYGSSTVLIGYFDTIHNDLHIASLGDSQCIVLRLFNRAYSCIWTTPIQEHSFNCPLQLAHVPKPKRCFEMGSSDLGCVLDSLHVVSDDPSQAVVQKTWVYTKDIVVAGTDGLFDNLSIKQIERITNRHILNVATLTSYHAQEVATALCREAFDSSKKPISLVSGDGFGGKEDDITCVVACVISL